MVVERRAAAGTVPVDGHCAAGPPVPPLHPPFPLPRLSEEFVDVRPLEHVHVHQAAVDLDRNDEVGVRHGAEGRVHQRLVQVQDQHLFAGVPQGLGTDDSRAGVGGRGRGLRWGVVGWGTGRWHAGGRGDEPCGRPAGNRRHPLPSHPPLPPTAIQTPPLLPVEGAGRRRPSQIHQTRRSAGSIAGLAGGPGRPPGGPGGCQATGGRCMGRRARGWPLPGR